MQSGVVNQNNSGGVLSRGAWEADGSGSTLAVTGGAVTVDLRIIKGVLKLDPASSPLEFFIAGGAQIYEQALPLCSDLYLTLVKREVEGDAFFPPFEDKFDLVSEVLCRPEFKVLYYQAKAA